MTETTTTTPNVPEFTVVPREMRDKITTIHRNRYSNMQNPLVLTLEKGETVFIKQTPRKLAGLYQQARRRDFAMVLRQGESNGEQGCYVWWEPKTVEEGE